MTDLSANTVITVGSIIAGMQGLQMVLNIRRLIAPKPPNQDLGTSITRLDAEVSEHARRIKAIEDSRALCNSKHMDEIGKLYSRINGTAERLAEIAGRLEGLVERRT